MTGWASREYEKDAVNGAYYLESKLDSMRTDLKSLEAQKPARPVQPEMPVQRVPDVPMQAYPTMPKIKMPKKWFLGAVIPLVYCMSIMPLSGHLSAQSAEASIVMGNVNTIVVVVMIACFVLGMIVRGKQQKFVKADYNRHPSAEYRRQCQLVDQINAQWRVQACADVQREFSMAMQNYQQFELPQYQKLLHLWQTRAFPEWQQEHDALTEAINETHAVLQEVYSITNVIPGPYRNLAAMTFIAAFMNTSQYDLRFAIERYDKSIDHLKEEQMVERLEASLMIQMQILEEAQYANALLEESNEIAVQGNELLRSIKRWTAANTAMHAYDIIHGRRIERERRAREDKRDSAMNDYFNRRSR